MIFLVVEFSPFSKIVFGKGIFLSQIPCSLKTIADFFSFKNRQKSSPFAYNNDERLLKICLV